MLIAYATDLGPDDAFVHATALAVSSGARLVTIHGNPDAATPDALPDAAALAARWGRTISQERRCHDCCDDVADTLIDAMLDLHPDLVIVGGHRRHGLAALVHGSVGQAVARNLDVPVLVVPDGARGFVEPSTGAIDMSRIMIPAGTREEARRGLDAARGLVALAGAHDTALEIVHVGDGAPLEIPGVTITRLHGNLEHAILELAAAHRACVIVMATRGHDSVGDILLGSHTERVIRETACPVLSVPIR